MLCRLSILASQTVRNSLQLPTTLVLAPHRENRSAMFVCRQ